MYVCMYLFIYLFMYLKDTYTYTAQPSMQKHWFSSMRVFSTAFWVYIPFNNLSLGPFNQPLSLAFASILEAKIDAAQLTTVLRQCVHASSTLKRLG